MCDTVINLDLVYLHFIYLHNEKNHLLTNTRSSRNDDPGTSYYYLPPYCQMLKTFFISDRFPFKMGSCFFHFYGLGTLACSNSELTSDFRCFSGLLGEWIDLPACFQSGETDIFATYFQFSFFPFFLGGSHPWGAFGNSWTNFHYCGVLLKICWHV